MKFVNRVIGKDGQERLYLRKRGEPAVRLRSAWGSSGLQREVADLLDKTRAKPLPGTLGLAIRAYELESPDFARLRASTKKVYRYLLSEMEDDFGSLPVAAFQASRVLQLRDVWAKRGYRAANLRLQLLKNVLRPALIAGLLSQDPFTHIQLVRRPSDAAEPHLVWPDAALRAVVEMAILEKRHGLARAIVLARFAGVRRGDLIALTESARQGGRVTFVSGKRKVPVNLPEDPELARWMSIIQANPNRAGSNDPHMVFGMRRGRYTEDGISQELAKLVRRLHLAGKLDSDRYDLHGLRHTRGVELALAGCTDAQGAAQMGHTSPSSFARYRRQADRIRMADDAAALVARLRAE